MCAMNSLPSWDSCIISHIGQWSFQSQNYTGVLLIQQNDIAHTPALFLQAHELPRGALVEYQVNWHTGRPGVQNNSPIDGLQINDDNDDDDDDDEMTAICDSSNQAGASITFDTCIASRGGQGGRGFLFIHGQYPFHLSYQAKWRIWADFLRSRHQL
jgi:hypothetical protein